MSSEIISAEEHRALAAQIFAGLKLMTEVGPDPDHPIGIWRCAELARLAASAATEIARAVAAERSRP